MSSKAAKKRDTVSNDKKYLGYLKIYADDKSKLEVTKPEPKKVVAKTKKAAPKKKAVTKKKAAPKKKAASNKSSSKKMQTTFADRYKKAKQDKKLISLNTASGKISRGKPGRMFDVVDLPLVEKNEKATKNKFSGIIALAAATQTLYDRGVDRLVEEKVLTKVQGNKAKESFAKKHGKKTAATKASPKTKASTKKKASPKRKASPKKAASPKRKASPKKAAPSKRKSSPRKPSPSRNRRSSVSNDTLDNLDIDLSPPSSPSALQSSALPDIGSASPSPSRLTGGIPQVSRGSRRRAGRGSPGRVAASRVSRSPRSRKAAPPLATPDLDDLDELDL